VAVGRNCREDSNCLGFQNSQMNQRQKRTMILIIIAILVVAFWELMDSQSGRFNWESFVIESVLISLLGVYFFIRHRSN
jgi:hypothetical protein